MNEQSLDTAISPTVISTPNFLQTRLNGRFPTVVSGAFQSSNPLALNQSVLIILQI